MSPSPVEPITLPSPVPHPYTTTRALLATELDQVESMLSDASWGPVPQLARISGHLVAAGGKRLRPMLTLLGAKLCGVPPRAALPVATASELIHSASLLHDDVVDATPTRRGQPAAPQVFGNSSCVLVGDALMAQALCMLGDLERREPLRSLARCVRRMAVGEIQQLSQCGRPHPRLLGYLRVIEGKTSALFAWCATVGGLCPDALRAHLRNFGRRLGMAFQIWDDILDYTGDPALSGKAVGSDLLEGKVTLPLHLACSAQPELFAAMERLRQQQPPDPEALQQLVRRVKHSGGIEQAEAMARTLLGRAHRALDNCPAGVWRDQLHIIADYVVHRRR